MQQQKSFQTETTSGKLYLVPTPIGNLQDMTFRAVETLKTVDLILAEDTRHTQKLLNHFDIQTPQMSYHEHNRKERLDEILARLDRGEDLAQVSDAGMPAISDPGFDLVQACIAHDVPVIPLPGANAALTGLIASGLATNRFAFIGFLPRKKSEKKNALEAHAHFPYTMAFYESPYRLKATLKEMVTAFGSDRQAVVVRELTKSYEEFTRGTLSEILAFFEACEEIKGEICLLIAGNPEALTEEDSLQQLLDEKPLTEQVKWWMETEGLRSKEAIKQVAKQTGRPKREVYNAYHVEGRD